MTYYTAPGITQKTYAPIELIVKKGAEFFNLTEKELKSGKRFRYIAEPRQMIMTFLYERRQHTLSVIGEYFGGRDHTTVMHAKNNIRDLMEVDEILREKYDQLKYHIIYK